MEKVVYFFDKKPLLVKTGNPDLEINTDTLTSLPILVRFQELELKYWGVDSLSKLGSILGIPSKRNRYTSEKEVLKYAWLLIDIHLDASFPDFIDFSNDQGVVVRVPISYGLKPLKCEHCHMFGHLVVDSKKKQQTKQVWQPVQK